MIEKKSMLKKKKRQAQYKKDIFKLSRGTSFQKARGSVWWVMPCQLKNVLSNIPIRILF